MKTHYILIAVLPLLAAACHSKKEQQAAVPSVDVAYPVVDSVTLTKTYPGYLTANREIAIVGTVNGSIASVDFPVGEHVRQGQVLFTIGDKTYRNNLAQAEASLANAEASQRYAATHYSALKEAFKGDAVSEIDVVQAKSTLDQCNAQVQAARVAVASARTKLGYCVIRAPFDGRISANELAVGAYISGEAAPVTLAYLYDDASMLANFSIDDDSAMEKLVHNIKTGNVDYEHIPIKFSEPMSHQYTGNLAYLAPKVNKSTGTLLIQAKIQNPERELRSGQFISIDLPIGIDPKAVLVRDASLGSDQLGKYLYVVNDSNRVVYTPVEVGALVNDSMRIVTKGISPKDKYVTRAMLKVRDGMSVNPIVPRK